MMGLSSGKQSSVMKHDFSMVPKAEIPRSSFRRSHGLKTTFESGYLVPIFLDEALPGDTFNLKVSSFARMATPIVPIMDNLFADTFFFAVPYRLVWENWEKFNGEQNNPSDSTDYLIPTLTSPTGGYTTESLEDYFGLPIKIAGITHSALWHRGYNLIWNEWFRDQNLQDSVTVEVDDGPDTPSNYTLLRRGKRHDYFTSCLPFPQKGPSVTIPLGSTAPVIGIGKQTQTFIHGTPPTVYESTGTTAVYPEYKTIDPSNVDNTFYIRGTADVGYPMIFADLSSATASTINALREAFQIQKLYERDARGGTRYTEIIRSHFGVTSPDARLQRPEYLGGGSTPILVTPIPQTSATVTGDTPQGNLSAIGVMSQSGDGFVRSFTEHCLIFGFISVRADLNYQQGLHRMWSRSARFDFYWPALSHIGEQAVLNQEIYAQGNASDTAVFGYQERFAEYRYKPSQITGQFRSTATTPLDIWHLAQNFGSLPTLNSTFIEENPPVARVIAVPSEPQFLLDCFFEFTTARPMPVYGVPGLIDHF